MPTAADSARLVARPHGFSGFAALRALSTVAMPIVSAINKRYCAIVTPKIAAELRVLDVLGVVDFVKNELKIDSEDFEKLVKQKIDGAALLETSVDELCDRCDLSAGAAHTIMRSIAPAVAEVRASIVPISNDPSQSKVKCRRVMTASR